jgi:glycosyltransferase involved in cell wall biosynthesis
MQTIDVVMLTKDSERLLSACLESIYDNVPVNRLIVVDGFSSDSTLKILDRFSKKYRNVEIISESGSRGDARNRGIREVQTDWFAFVDSDVILCKDWFRKASKYIGRNVGAILGVDVPGDVRNRYLMKIFQWMEARVYDIRGSCHDALIRYNAVKDIRIPSELHVLEDAYIKEWIAAKNYGIIFSNLAYCRHYKQVNSLLSRENSLSTISELKNFRLVRERLVYAMIFGLAWLLQELGSKNKARGLK